MGFNKQQLDKITTLASKGFSMRQTADYLGLTYLEFFRLVKQYPEVVSSCCKRKAMGVFEKDK